LLKISSFFGDNCPLNWTDLQTNSTINASGKVNPVPVSSFSIFTGTFVDTGNWAGINAVGNAFTNISNDGMGHCVLFGGIYALFLA